MSVCPNDIRWTICPGLFRGLFKKKGHACGLTQKGQKSPLQGHNYELLPLILLI